MTRLDEVFSEVDSFNEEQDKEVKINESQARNLHFEKEDGENPIVEYVDDKFNKGKKKAIFTWNVINLDSKSQSVKIFVCSEATARKIYAGLKTKIYDLYLENFGAPMGFRVTESKEALAEKDQQD